MKKLSALVLAVCFVLGSLSTAAAADVKVKGDWHFSYGYYGNFAMYDNDAVADNKMDPFQARQRVRTQIEFIASETLSAMLHFEIGAINFGQNGGGGVGGTSGWGLDADGVNIKTRYAVLDWTIPQTKTHIRMGLHKMALPSMVFGDNFVFVSDTAGIAINQEITPEVGLTAFWARPRDTEVTGGENNDDEMDIFALMVPVKTDVIRITPWAAAAVIGKNSGHYPAAADRRVIHQGRYVAADALKDRAVAWWVGTSFELPVLDPFVVKFDGMYGQLNQDDSADGNNYDQRGYFLAAQLGYKFDWGTASVIGWYGSGDNNDESDRYGTIPVVGIDGGFGPGIHAFGGNRFLQRGNLINNSGAGTWGVGIALDNMSFVPNLTHGFRAFMFRGTNKGDRIQGDEYFYSDNTRANGNHQSYLISSDFGFGAAWTNTYKFNANFLMGLDFGYTHLDLSNQRRSEQRDTEDAYNAILSFGYSF